MITVARTARQAEVRFKPLWLEDLLRWESELWETHEFLPNARFIYEI